MSSEDLLRVLVERSPVGQFVSALNGAVVFANQAYADLVGRPLDEVVGLRPVDVLHPDDLEALQREGTRLTTGAIDRMVLESRHVAAAGLERWVRTTTSLVRDADDQPQWFLTFVEDITERRAAQQARRESEALHRTVLDALDEAILVFDRNAKLISANASSARVLDTELTALFAGAIDPANWTVQREDGSTFSVDDLPLRVTLRTGKPIIGELVHIERIDRPGTGRWISLTSLPLVQPGESEPYAVVGSLADVTERRRGAEATNRLAMIVESTSDLVIVFDAVGTLLYLNRAAREAHGFVDASTDRVTRSDLYTPASTEHLERSVLPQLAQGNTWSGELDLYRGDMSVMKVWQTITPELQTDGSIGSFSAVGRDITEQTRAAAALAHQATHDPLTGLPNRTLLLEHLDVAVHRAARRGDLLGVLFIDVDHFKRINDGYGHEAGDALLRQVARRLTAVVRPFDIVARLGGDEFVLVCGEIETQDEPMAIAERVLTALGRHPFAVGESEVPVTASIGLAIATGGDAQAEGLLREADAAMYRAKARGRARIERADELTRR